MEADLVRIDDLHCLDLPLEFRSARPLIPFEAELHVLRRERIAVVERDPLAELKRIRAPVGTLTPLRRQTGRHGVVGHGFDQRIMHGIEKHIRGDHASSLRWIEPGGRNGDVNRPGHLPAGSGFLRHGAVQARPTLPGEEPGGTTRVPGEPDDGKAKTCCVATDGTCGRPPPGSTARCVLVVGRCR